MLNFIKLDLLLSYS